MKNRTRNIIDYLHFDDIEEKYDLRIRGSHTGNQIQKKRKFFLQIKIFKNCL